MKRLIALFLLILFSIGLVSATSEWYLNTSIRPSSDDPVGVEWSPNGEYIAISDGSDTWYIYNASDWSNVVNLSKASNTPKDMAWSPNNDYFVYGARESEGIAYVHEVGGGWDNVENLTESSSWAWRIDWSPTGDYIAVGDRGSPSRVNIYDSGFNFVRNLTKGTEAVFSVSFSPSGDYFAYSEWGGTDKVFIYNTSNWNNFNNLTMSTSTVDDITWSPSGDSIAYGGYDQKIWVHNTNDWGLEETINYPSDGVESIEWGPNDDYLAATLSGENVISVFNTTDWSHILNLTKADEPIGLDFSPSGDQIAYGDFYTDSETYIHEVGDWRPFIRENLGSFNVDSRSSSLKSNVSLGAGDLRESPVELIFRARPFFNEGQRNLNGLPADGGDNLLAADWLENPSGGKKGYVGGSSEVYNDQSPIQPGDSLSYIYNESGSGAETYYYLTDYAVDSQGFPSFGDIYSKYVGDSYSDGLNRIEINYSESGDQVNFTVFDSENGGAIISNDSASNSAIINAEEVFFHLYEYGGGTGNNSLRLVEASGSVGALSSKKKDSINSNGVYNIDFDSLYSDAIYNFKPILNYSGTDIGQDDYFKTKSLPLMILDLPPNNSKDKRVDTNFSISLEGNVTVNTTFYENVSGGSDELIGEVNDVDATPSGTIAELDTNKREFEPNSTVDWYVNVTDGYNVKSNGTWSFETEERPEVVPGSLNPSDGANDVEASPELALNVTDDVNSVFTGVEFYNASDDSFIGSDTGVANNSKANITWSDADQGDTTYEWYAVLETDSGIRLNTSNSTDYPDSWNFTTEQVLNANAGILTDDVNRDPNGSYIGSSELKTHVYNDQGLAMDVNISVKDGGTWKVIENMQNVGNNSVVATDISDDAFISRDSVYDWKAEVVDGSVLAQNSSTFSTHVLEVDVASGMDEFSEVELYYSNQSSADLSDYRLLETFETSSGFKVNVSNRELDAALGSNEACFKAIGILYNVKGSPVEQCAGGEIS